MNIVILGLGTAGFSAMMAVKRTNPSAEITIIDDKDHDLTHNCGLPYAVEGILKEDGLKHALGLEQMKVKLIKNSVVKKIDFEKKKINYETAETSNPKSKKSKSGELSYEKLIIASGASAFIPPVKKIDDFIGKNIFSLQSIEDAKLINQKIKKNKTAIVVGAGAIGIETAFALRKKGMDVVVAEMLGNVLPRAIDKDIAEVIEEKMKNKGIKLLLGKKVEEILGDKTFKGAKIGDEKVNAEMMIVAAGVRPNISFIDNQKLKTGNFGILTDKKMRTNLEGVYAAGDCVQVDSVINQKRTIAWLANSAYIQGTVAGTNVAGGFAEYPGTGSTFVTVFDDVEIASTGFSTQIAESYGYEVISGKFKGKTLPEFYPGGKEITVKILADKFNGKIIGCQAVGEGAAARINVVATAISAGMFLEQFTKLELAYCPPVSDVRDALMFAADQAFRKFKATRKE